MVLTSDLIQTDGFSTIITITGVTDNLFEEAEVTTPSVEAGGKIDMANMRSPAGWRAAATKKMKSMGDITIKAFWKTSCLSLIMTLVGQPRLYIVTYPDGATLTLWAALDSFKPGANKEGEAPMADIVITALLRNPATGATVAPVYVPGPTVV